MGEVFDREMSVAASIASVTVAMFNARHHALMRGETDDSLAKRIGLNLREWRDKFLHPDTLAIDALSDIFYACYCDPIMTLRDARGPEVFAASGALPASDQSAGGKRP